MTDYRFPNARLLLFAREPVAGRVKTRLQPDLSTADSLMLHRALLQRSAQTLSNAPLAPWQLWVDGDPGHPDFLELANAAAIHRQQGADLGERMYYASQQALAEPGVEAVVLVGADCPAVDGAYLGQALQALFSDTAAVVGPAEDGGYVLLGLRVALAEIFTGVRWGGAQVCRQTLDNLRAVNIDPVILEARWDVDRPADLLRLSQLQPPLRLEPGLSARIAELAVAADDGG